jgi:hypothetical protein
MSLYKYRLITGGWGFLIMLLTLFWYFTLRRLSEVMKAHVEATQSRESVPGFAGLFLYLFRGEFKKSDDQRFVAVCRRLRQPLYGYIGAVGAYVIFLVLMHPRY